MWALSSMNEQLLELQIKDRVADLNEVDHSIETWWIIYDLGLEFQKDPSVCDIWTDDVKVFSNLYAYSTLGHLTNNVGSSNIPCSLQRAVEKLCTIHNQVGILIRFAFCARTRFMLYESTLVITPVKLDAPKNKNKQPIPSTETGWSKVLQGIFDRQDLQFDGSPEEAQANQKSIFSKALAQKSCRVEHCECLLVAYLLRHNSPIAVLYIGLSKLSCKACFLWLQAVGEVTGCNFNSKGCHNEWYPGWSTPALIHHRFKYQIDHLFLNKVELKLCDGLQASGPVRQLKFHWRRQGSHEALGQDKVLNEG